MTNKLLSRIYRDAGRTIEKELGTKAVLISPDGEKYTKSAVDEDGVAYDESTPAEERRDLECSVFQEHLNIDVRTGFDKVVDRPVAVFWRPSLERVPEDGERWLVQIPEGPLSDVLKSYVFSEPPKGSKTIGFINLRLRRVGQKEL
jgi:hypothetical protein